MTTRNRRGVARRLLAAATACGMVLAACGGDDDDDEASGSAASVAAEVTDAAGTEAPTETEAPSATEAPAPTGGTAATEPTASEESSPAGTEAPVDDREVDPNGVVTFTYAVPNGTMDPAKAASPFDLAYMRPVYDTLMVRAEDGTIQPGLATEWEFEDNALVLTLLEGVTFHDGTPFNADAVKANLERQMTVEGGTQKSFLASVDTVEVVDDTTVRLTLKSGAGALVAALTGYPGIMVSPAALGGDLTTTAVGTGPYVLDHSDPGVEAVYTPYDGAWQPEEAAAAEIRIITQADAGQRLNQIKSGDADAANMDPNLVEDAEAAGMQVLAKEANNVWSVHFNTARPALAEADARRAISLAIDRDALVEGLDFGYGTSSSQVLPPSEPGSNPDVTPVYDPEEARTLAESSGLSGQTLVFLGSAIPTITGYQEALQAMFADAGINVEIKSVERAQTTDELLAGDWDVYMNFWPGAADPWLTYNAFFGPDSIWFPGEAPAAVVDLMSQAETETETDVRTGIFEELAQTVDDESLVAIISHPRRPVVAAEDVTGFQGNVHGVPQLRGTGKAAS